MGQALEAGLYLHVPFCRAKCPYCDFYSLPGALSLVTDYLKALKKEIALWAPEVANYRLVTFYAGGGTPSLLPPEFYATLFETLEAFFCLELKELTLEANPEGLSLKTLQAYREIGFNRLSLGVQSLDPRGLGILGRRHGVAEVRRAVLLAREAGFENLSLDLIFAWPGQDLSILAQELEALLELAPEHVSCYELTLEPHTPLARQVASGELSLPPEETVVEMYALIQKTLKRYGFFRYEISNYARAGYQCQHNRFYWERRPFLGLGPAAASHVGETRYKNAEDLRAYLEALAQGKFPPREEEHLSKEAAFREAVVLGLRLLEGVSAQELKRRFGLDLSSYYGKELEDLVAQGLLCWQADRLRLTPKGLLVASQIQARLI